MPEGRRPLEGLVIEASNEKGREKSIDAHHVEPERRPAVLAAGHKAVIELDRRCAGVGLAPAALAQLDKSIGLGRARCEQAAGAMILEAAADKPVAIGQKRRGECVASTALKVTAVKAEPQTDGAVDKAPFGKATRLVCAHCPAPAPWAS